MLYSLYLLVRRSKIDTLHKESIWLKEINFKLCTCSIESVYNLGDPWICNCLEVNDFLLFIEVIGTYGQIYYFQQDLVYNRLCRESWDRYFNKSNTLYYLQRSNSPYYLTFHKYCFRKGNRKYFGRRNDFYSNGLLRINNIENIKKNIEDMEPTLLDIFDEELDRCPDLKLIYLV